MRLLTKQKNGLWFVKGLLSFVALTFALKRNSALVTQDSSIAFQNFAILISIGISIKIHISLYKSQAQIRFRYYLTLAFTFQPIKPDLFHISRYSICLVAGTAIEIWLIFGLLTFLLGNGGCYLSTLRLTEAPPRGHVTK